jgi:hypothetical protein
MSQSFDYISHFQKKLLKYNIENYISGGFAQKLYLQDLIKTEDVDIVLLYDEKVITNKILIENTKYILRSALSYLLKKSTSGILELFSIVKYNSKKDLTFLTEFAAKNKFTLVSFHPIYKKNIYFYNFERKIGDIIIHFNVKITNDVKSNIENYISLKFHNEKEEYLPMDILILNKRKINTDIIKNFIKKKIDKNIFYIYSVKALLYNLMNIYFDYQQDIKRTKLICKIKECKNKRDEKRLYYILRLYCNTFYKTLTETDIKKIFKIFKINNKKFKLDLFKVKNLDVIDKIIIHYIHL